MLETGTTLNAPGGTPEDDRLAKDLEATLHRAIDAAKHHRNELERAERVARSCKAALEQLDGRDMMAEADEGSLPEYPSQDMKRGY